MLPWKRVWLWVGLASAALLPLALERPFQGGDTSSHVYNAWLASTPSVLETPGFQLRTPLTNFLTDWLLAALLPSLGWQRAETLVVGGLLLAFFLSAALLCASLTGKPSWPLAPLLTVLAYGWSMRMGFLNYQLGLVFAFFAIAAASRRGGGSSALAAVLLLLSTVAHPLGALWGAVGIGVVLPWRILTPARRAACLLAFGGVLLGWKVWLAWKAEVPFHLKRVIWITGVEQAFIFGGAHYLVTAALALAVGLGLWHLLRSPPALPRQRVLLMLVCAAAFVFLLPAHLPPDERGVALSFTFQRASLISAVFGVMTLAWVPSRAWVFFGGLVLASLFHAQSFFAAREYNWVEADIRRAVSAAPPGSRMLNGLCAWDNIRAGGPEHLIDRACIGHCFSYGNYEPASHVFRIRAVQPNPVAFDQFTDVLALLRGEYRVRPEELPVWVVEPCGASTVPICIRELSAGEVVPRRCTRILEGWALPWRMGRATTPVEAP